MARPILIADVPEVEEFLRSCFAHRDVRYVSRMAQAAAALAAQDFDLILIGMHFDDSQMFALLRHVRALRRHAATPVVCVRALPSVLSRSAQESLSHAARILGADAFIDMGPGAEAAAEFCRVVEGHLRDGRDPLAPAAEPPLSKPFDIA